jgi:phage terminase small subunit
MKTVEPKPPAHLSTRSKKLWNESVEGYVMEPHELELLRLLCEALDRAEQARVVIADEGAFVVDRYGGKRSHPALAVERDSRLAAVRLVRALDFQLPAKPADRHRAPDRIRRVV